MIESDLIPVRVVYLTHYIPLYQTRVLQAIADQVRDFHVLVSTPIEPNRDFSPDWAGLDVTVQDTWTLRRKWRHRGQGEFSDSLYIHFPYDTGRRLAELKPDVVMSLELGPRSLGAARYCRRNAAAKLVLCTYMSCHTEQSRGRLRAGLRRYLLRSADAVTYNGPSCKQYLQRYSIPPQNLFHLPYAADDRTLHRGPIDRDEQNVRSKIVVIGQLSQRKGVLRMLHQLIDYARRHPLICCEISLIGSGPLRSQIECSAVPKNLLLRMVGNVSAADLCQRLQGCGLMIAPTLADEWMLVVNEALQAGVPVIGSVYSQAVTTLIQNGMNGWQYDPADPDSLSTRLDAYFNRTDQQIAAMRHAARTSVKHRTPQWAAAGAINAIRHVTGHPAGQQAGDSFDANADSLIGFGCREIVASDRRLDSESSAKSSHTRL